MCRQATSASLRGARNQLVGGLAMGYGTVARAFHWITLLLVLIMIPVGLIMTQEIPRPLQDRLFILHKGLGPIVFVVVVLRLLWRWWSPPPPLPDHVAPLQRRTAAVVHVLLYTFLLIMAVSGYVRVTTGGFPIETLESVGIPPLLPKSEGIGDIASTIHRISAFCLMALIAMHVAAAAFHGLFKRDGVFSMMWPPIAPKTGPKSPAA
jgi:cytochrome b561